MSLLQKNITVKVSNTNYENVLNPDRYITGDVQKVSKWKVNNKLLGNGNFCPVVRRTTELEKLLAWDVQQKMAQLKHDFPPQLFKRASYYLYKKEKKETLSRIGRGRDSANGNSLQGYFQR